MATVKNFLLYSGILYRVTVDSAIFNYQVTHNYVIPVVRLLPLYRPPEGTSAWTLYGGPGWVMIALKCTSPVRMCVVHERNLCPCCMSPTISSVLLLSLVEPMAWLHNKL